MLVRDKTGKGLFSEVKDVFLKISPESYILNLNGVGLQRILKQMLSDDYYKPMLKHLASGKGTSVALGKCPYPLECSCYENCDRYECNCDSIDSDTGYTYRQS